MFYSSKGGNKGASVPSDNNSKQFLRNWKPKRPKHKNADPKLHVPSLDELELEERAKTREQRYKSLYHPKFDESHLGYDIYDCPPKPPPNYPAAWTTVEVLGNWNPNDVTTISPDRREVYQGLCYFDHETQYDRALAYRKAEKPFVMYNDLQVVKTARQWEDDPEYLHRVFGDEREFRTERSPNTFFMWYRLRGGKNGRPNEGPPGYHRPDNDEVEMTFGEWLEHALEKDGEALEDEELMNKAKKLRERRLHENNIHNNNKNKKKKGVQHDDPIGDDDDETKKDNEEEDDEETKRRNYYYFRLNADLKSASTDPMSPSAFIYEQLPFFDPTKRKSSEFYIVDPHQERGINCRFGMRGVTAANHFDMSRNTIAVLGGERRYVLANPDQCTKMGLYPKGHPSVRHSSVDWSSSTPQESWPENFKDARVNEVVLHAGDVLYLPTNWFHFIVNLSLNYQCNARSGITHETAKFIQECGYDMK